MTRQQVEALGYVVETRQTGSGQATVAVVTLKRGTTNAPWASVEQTLDSPGVGNIAGSVFDDLVDRISSPVPADDNPAPRSPIPSGPPAAAPNNVKADTLLTVWVDGVAYELLARVKP